RLRARERGAAVDRGADHDPAVVAVILKHRISHDHAPAGVDDDLRAGVRSAIDPLRRLVDGDGPVEAVAEVTRMPGHDPAAGSPHQPYGAICCESRCRGGCAVQTGILAR